MHINQSQFCPVLGGTYFVYSCTILPREVFTKKILKGTEGAEGMPRRCRYLTLAF